MEFSDLIEKRYSVRAYKPDPVEDEVLNQVLEAARLAPTAANLWKTLTPTRGSDAGPAPKSNLREGRPSSYANRS